jgi:putative MATE family efflux protein
MLFLVISYLLVAALQGAGDTITPLILLIFGNALNILGNYVCIFGVGPFPEMGVAGAAVGSIGSRAVVAAILAVIVLSGRYVIHVPLSGSWRLRSRLIKRIFYIGLPAGLEEILRNIGFLTIIKILTLTSAGMFAISAFTVAGQIRMVGIMVGLSLMGAATTAVGQNCGAGNTDRARRSAWITAGIAAAISTCMAITYVLLRQELIMVFNTEADVVRIGAEALLVLAISEPFITASMSLAGALRGAGDTWWPLYVTAATFTAIAPLMCYLLGIVVGMQTVGVWLGLDISVLLGFIALAWHFRRGRWMKIVLT